MRKPYRVIVWGPGAMGQAAIRELLKRKEFEIVGCLGYSASKAGKDIGDLVGHSQIGVKITTDKEAIFALEADCVVHTSAFQPTVELSAQQDEDIIRLLESGKNVVTVVGCTYPLAQGTEYAKRFEEACKKGNSSLHGTGENPGIWFERIALSLTTVCNEVEYIKLSEYVDVSVTNPETIKSLGIAQTQDVANQVAETLAKLWKRYHFNETLNFASKSLYGKPIDRIETVPVFHIAQNDIEFAKNKGDPVDIVIKKGEVQAITYHHNGYVDGRIRLIDSVNWFVTQKTSPIPGKKEGMWDIEIEGKPTSLQCTFRAQASIKDNIDYYPGDPTTPTWYVTIVPVIQAIPIVCAAAPGIVYPSVFTSCVPDYRQLESRSSLVS